MYFAEIILASVPNGFMYGKVFLQIPLIEWFTAEVTAFCFWQVKAPLYFNMKA